jgi:hypothetical protein
MRKTSLLLETDPTVSGQAPPTWVCTPSQEFTCGAFGSISSSRCQTTRLHRVTRPDGVEKMSTDEHEIPAGGARRDRTDDLLLAKQALSQLSYGPSGRQRTDDRGQKKSLEDFRRPSCVFCRLIMVGLGRFELPTSRLSSARSNQLSYKPAPGFRRQSSVVATCVAITDLRLLATGLGSSAKKEKRRRRCPA